MGSVPEPSPPKPPFGDLAFGACTLGLADFVHAVRHEPRTRALLLASTVAGSVCLPLGVWLLTAARPLAGALSCLFGMACFAAHQAPEQAAARWFEKTPREARSLKYTLNPEALIVVTDVSRRAYPWRSLDAYHEAPESFLVWVSSRSFLIVPKRAFASGDLPRVAARLSREIGAAPEPPRYWSWLLGAAALVLALLGAWNWLDPR